jgi:hypothetical protein
MGVNKMDDLISRQAAIDALRHAWAKGLEPTQFLEELPSAQPEQRWIPFKTRPLTKENISQSCSETVP